jgi:hypothetical protein
MSWTTKRSHEETEDLPREEVDAAKKRSRINALVLAGVFIILTLAPSPYNLLAPLLFLVPLIYSIAARGRKNSDTPAAAAGEPQPQPTAQEPGKVDPYSCTPRDPQDPRRYKPIG